MEAVHDERDAARVEGILRLYYVPSVDYVQVAVQVGPRELFVDPASVVVVRRGDTPLVDDQIPRLRELGGRRRRITDLDAAKAMGLVPRVRTRRGGSWADMRDRLQDLAAALLAAGWQIVRWEQAEDPQDGDSVFCDLERGDRTIELEYTEDEFLTGWPVGEDEADDQPSLFTLGSPTPDMCAAAYAEHGWL